MTEVLIAAATQVATKTAPWSIPVAQNDRIDEYDVHHREKRRYAGDEFGADIGSLLGKSEISLERGTEPGFGLPHWRCAPWLFDHIDPLIPPA